MATAVMHICDPGLYRLNEAIQQANNSAEAAPGFEIDLVRYLQEHCASRHVLLPVVFRGLEILGGMRDGGTIDESRLVTLLRPFLRSRFPQIVSKCVLVMGRQSSSMTWLHGVMAETDDRIRANLIESLWRRNEPEVELVLRSALLDSHPRVAANAVYGLYLLGIDAWVEGLERLVGSEDAAFRISGIWVIKSSGAPDAPARIRLLIRDTDAKVRRAAFDALIHLREHGSKKTPSTAGVEVSA
jgi:HEAT repeat protein